MTLLGSLGENWIYQELHEQAKTSSHPNVAKNTKVTQENRIALCGLWTPTVTDRNYRNGLASRLSRGEACGRQAEGNCCEWMLL